MFPLKAFATLHKIINYGANEFRKAKLYFGHGTDNALDEAIFLALNILCIPQNIINIPDKELTQEERRKILNIFKKRIDKRIPAPYLTKEAWFAELPFYVDKRVLIPRSSFGELIKNKFHPWINKKIKYVLEIGTGSGCIAIAMAIVFKNIYIDATDIENDALNVAKINMKRYKIKKRITLIKSDVFDNIDDKKYDIIISNPPYVGINEFKSLPPEYRYEPSSALLADKNGLNIIMKILIGSAKYLTEDGLLFVEVGNSEMILMKHFPKVPFVWLTFENSEGGIFLLTKKEIVKAFNTAL